MLTRADISSRPNLIFLPICGFTHGMKQIMICHRDGSLIMSEKVFHWKIKRGGQRIRFFGSLMTALLNAGVHKND